MRKAVFFRIIAAVLVCSGGTALAGKLELPDWSGGAGPDDYVLGGLLWPNSPSEVEGPEPVPEPPIPPAPAPEVAVAREESSTPPPPQPAPAAGATVNPASLPRVEKIEDMLRGGPQNLRLPIALIQPLPIERIGEMDRLPEVAGELSDEYFALRPVEHFIDPQQLMTEQKANDVLRFLQFHAEEAEYDIYLLLFGRDQKVPDEISLDQRHRDWFPSEKAVTVAYFLEEPERTQITFNAELREKLPEAVFDRIFQNCVREAQVAETPFDQVERLAIELSIRLYWMSKLLERQSAGETIATTQEELSQPVWENIAQPEPPHSERLAELLGVLPWGWIFGGLAGTALIVLITVHFWRRDSLSARPALFPERELPTRLGGMSSGGAYIGISFEVGEGS